MNIRQEIEVIIYQYKKSNNLCIYESLELNDRLKLMGLISKQIAKAEARVKANQYKPKETVSFSKSIFDYLKFNRK